MALLEQVSDKRGKSASLRTRAARRHDGHIGEFRYVTHHLPKSKNPADCWLFSLGLRTLSQASRAMRGLEYWRINGQALHRTRGAIFGAGPAHHARHLRTQSAPQRRARDAKAASPQGRAGRRAAAEQ